MNGLIKLELKHENQYENLDFCFVRGSADPLLSHRGNHRGSLNSNKLQRLMRKESEDNEDSITIQHSHTKS